MEQPLLEISGAAVCGVDIMVCPIYKEYTMILVSDASWTPFLFLFLIFFIEHHRDGQQMMNRCQTGWFSQSRRPHT